MKIPWLAFVMSFVLPGAGLAYVGKWVWGLLNFVVVQAILLGILLLGSGTDMVEHFHYILLALAAASAGVAHAAALQSRAAANQ